LGALARSIVWVGAALLVALALCPKAAIVFVLTPEPVKAAVFLFLAGFTLTQGCQLVTTRLLDARRVLVVGFGLTAGLVEAIAPQAFVQSLPALASPVAFGSLVAFMANLLTLPLVQKRASFTVDLAEPIGLRLSDWLASLAGSWSLKPQTAGQVAQSIEELVELLQERGAQKVTVTARFAEDRVEYSLQWAGQALPEPPSNADADDLMGDDPTRHRFVMWMATRQSLSYRQRPTSEGHEFVLVFED
jgi:NCS2 family nucleobase:cation symporter-2